MKTGGAQLLLVYLILYAITITEKWTTAAGTPLNDVKIVPEYPEILNQLLNKVEKLEAKVIKLERENLAYVKRTTNMYNRRKKRQATNTVLGQCPGR